MCLATVLARSGQRLQRRVTETRQHAAAAEAARRPVNTALWAAANRLRQHTCMHAAALCDPPSERSTSEPPLLGWGADFQAEFEMVQPQLGAGSFGKVHAAIHKPSGAGFAVKVLSKQRLGSCRLQAIQQEVQHWLEVQGCHFVARLEGLYEDEEHAYIVQELCQGGDLRSLLKQQGRLAESDAAAIMRGVLDVLVECHRRSLVYGDCKPANFLLRRRVGASSPPTVGSSGDSTTELTSPDELMLSLASPDSSADDGSHTHRGLLASAWDPLLGAAGEGLQHSASAQGLFAVRAVDFGCSHSAAGRKRHHEAHRGCTPLYSAPELPAMTRPSTAVDMWAAGVMMYQLLTGRLPFWRNKGLQEVAQLPRYELLAAVRTHDICFPRDVWSLISVEARDLVSQMLERSPSARIDAESALRHPWFRKALGYAPKPSSDAAHTGAAAAGASSSNVVAFSALRPSSGAGVPLRAAASVVLSGLAGVAGEDGGVPCACGCDGADLGVAAVAVAGVDTCTAAWNVAAAAAAPANVLVLPQQPELLLP